jgi:ankyrin repeat protein
MDAIDARPLPPRPSEEQYKKQAKDLVKACRAGDHEALRRLNDQPAYDESTARVTASTCRLADAQFTVAREYGFKSWPRFAEHLRGLVQGPVGHYEAAVDAIVTGDLPALESLLDTHPELVRTRSTRAHAATLLHYVAANGVENYRQKTPPNAVEIADLLLRRGSEADALAFVYGGDCTTMTLLVSSAHPANRGVQEALVDKLVDFGAAPNGPKDDGDPLLTALIFGYPATAAALVRRGARVDTIVTAAGMGDEERVRDCFDADGTPRPDVPVVRSRARWMPQGVQANVEWALVLATWMGHAEVVDFLSSRVDLAARGPHGFTALHWAVLTGNLALVDLLLDRGAPLEARDRNHNSTVLGTALWVATNENPDERTRVLPVIERLLEAGARTDAVIYPTGDEAVDLLLQRHGAG